MTRTTETWRAALERITRVSGILLLTATSASSQVSPPKPAASTPAATGAAEPPPPAASAGAAGPLPGGRALGALGGVLPLPLPAPREGARSGAPGAPPRGGRPRPGGIFDPGAAGPGISQSGDQNFLDGALDTRTGWPFVFLDHFQPRADRLNAVWIVSTRDCPQEMGSDPWPKLQVEHFDEKGNLVVVSADELFAQTVGRPVLIQVQGSLTTPDIALGGLLWTHAWLQTHRCLPPDAIIIAFDWPSQRIYRNQYLDINEKGRRSFVAAYHLAKFVERFPASSRICLLGQSYGGRVVPGALHLLGGGSLKSKSHEPEVQLAATRPDLHLHGVIIAGAADRTWLDPGQRFDKALTASSAFLNLYNHKDESLILYPFLLSSNHHRALGRLGLSRRDFETLGPTAARYEEHDIHDILRTEHSLLDAVANQEVGRWIAPYVWAPDPGPSEETPEKSSAFNGDQSRGQGRRSEVRRNREGSRSLNPRSP
jgi:hypothetical protein